MYLIALFVAIAAIASVGIYHKDALKKPRRFALRLSAWSACALGAGFFTAAFVGLAYQPVLKEQTWELVSLRTDNAISGVFVLGSGSVSSGTQYHVLLRNSDGSFSPFTVDPPAHVDVRIIEDPAKSKTGELIIRTTHADKKWGLFDSRVIQYVLVVPPGSVIQSIRIQ